MVQHHRLNFFQILFIYVNLDIKLIFAQPIVDHELMLESATILPYCFLKHPSIYRNIINRTRYLYVCVCMDDMYGIRYIWYVSVVCIYMVCRYVCILSNPFIELTSRINMKSIIFATDCQNCFCSVI